MAQQEIENDLMMQNEMDAEIDMALNDAVEQISWLLRGLDVQSYHSEGLLGGTRLPELTYQCSCNEFNQFEIKIFYI